MVTEGKVLPTCLLGKPTPSKWDDAQKWLVGLSRGDRSHAKASPRNSNADDRRLIAPTPQKEEVEEENTKNVDCEELFWQINKPPQDSAMAVRSVCVRDMGTEMTPIPSQEPSRTATPVRATSPMGRSPICSGASTPLRCQRGPTDPESYQTGLEESKDCKKINLEDERRMNPLETRAMAWDEAERAKYMARYKREEVKIQAWENHEKRKAEMEMKRMEVRAERLKSRAQEKLVNRLTATRRIAEEKRANAEAKLNEKAVRTSEKADYIRRTGQLPSSFSFKLPSLCW